MLTPYTSESIGPRPTMQDTLAVNCDDTVGIFGVFDGHGTKGAEVAADLQASIEAIDLTALAKGDHSQAIGQITQALAGVQNDWAPRREQSPEQSGSSTAVIALVGESAISSLWIGDGGMGFYPDTGKPTMLIRPHDATHEQEVRRVRDMGYAVDARGRFPRATPVSRAIGHGIDRPFVSADPDSHEKAQKRQPGLLILGSDGVCGRNPAWASMFDSMVMSAVPEDYQALADELATNGAEINRDNAAVMVVRCD